MCIRTRVNCLKLKIAITLKRALNLLGVSYVVFFKWSKVLIHKLLRYYDLIRFEFDRIYAKIYPGIRGSARYMKLSKTFIRYVYTQSGFEMRHAHYPYLLYLVYSILLLVPQCITSSMYLQEIQVYNLLMIYKVTRGS